MVLDAILLVLLSEFKYFAMLYYLEPLRIYHILVFVEGFKRCCISGDNGEHGVFSSFYS